VGSRSCFESVLRKERQGVGPAVFFMLPPRICNRADNNLIIGSLSKQTSFGQMLSGRCGLLFAESRGHPLESNGSVKNLENQ
jgi:hypothetical protein